MGGKGRRRREKNYRAAHGGHSGLPPPPKPYQDDAIPSKLRQLISLSSPSSSNPNHNPKPSAKRKRDKDEEKVGSRNKSKQVLKKVKEDALLASRGKGRDKVVNNKESGDSDRDVGTSGGDEDDVDDICSMKKKRKRNRKQVEDLRFVMGEKSKRSEKRKERKKYMETKKRKQKTSITEEGRDFPGREDIKFGDVVQAPPKLVTFPKVMKKVQDASQERLRLQAIDAYRKRKGWTSRPGLQLPPVAMTPPM